MKWARTPRASPAFPTTTPDSLDGPEFARLLQAIPLRISLLGTRGKRTLATMAVAALQRRGHAVHADLDVPTDAPPVPASASALPPSAASTFSPQRVQGLLARFGIGTPDEASLDDVRAAIRRAGPVGALLLRNRATGTSEQRAFHTKVVLPHYVLLTNVRRDGRGLRPQPRHILARALVRSVTPGATLLSGESDPHVRAAIRRECERQAIPLVEAPPGRTDVPGMEAVSLLDTLLRHRFGTGLDASEADAFRRDLEARFRWSSSLLQGVRWFDAGAIDDTDSVRNTLAYLQSRGRQPVTYIAYLRGDRPGQARAFIPLLADLLAEPDTRQVMLAGPWARLVADRLQPWQSQVRLLPGDVVSVQRLVRRLQSEAQGGALMLLGDNASAWPRELSNALQKQPAALAARSAHAEAQAAAPRRIVRPLVAPAPSIPQFGESFVGIARGGTGARRSAVAPAFSAQPAPTAGPLAKPTPATNPQGPLAATAAAASALAGGSPQVPVFGGPGLQPTLASNEPVPTRA